MRNTLGKKRILIVAVFTVSLTTTITAQISTGGTYRLEQSVMSGGGKSGDVAAISIEGTLGQPYAGTTSSATPYSIHGGFWQGFLVPMAAMVSFSGRVLTSDGRNVINPRIVLTDMTGVTRSALSNRFLYYRFDDVEVGQAYIITATAKRLQFTPRVINLTDELPDFDLTAVP